MERKKTAKSELIATSKKIAAAHVRALFALKDSEDELRNLPVGATIGEEGLRLAKRIMSLTLTVEELDRALYNIQGAIESY